jgi:putative exporter of polyketide antibiotics
MLALIIAGFAVSSALRNRSEKAAGYAESMLARPVSRW